MGLRKPKPNSIIFGDCMEVVKKWSRNCIDTIITDPPYGLNFMGKYWDKGIPGVEFWKAFLRVAKPGAILMAFGGTRTFHRLTCAIEDAGWEIRDCLMWLYGCLSEDTEILTIDGWKRYHKGIDKHPVLCYNAETGKFEFQTPRRKFLYENKHTAYRIQSDKTDQIVSRNHRCLVEQNGRKVFKRAEELAREHEASIPFLESLSDLPQDILNKYKGAGNKESALLSNMCEQSNRNEKPREKARENTVPSLWDNVLSCRTEQKQSSDNVFQTVQWIGARRKVEEAWTQGSLQMDREKQKGSQEKDDRKKQSCMERWCYILQKAWQLCSYKICQMSEKVFDNVTERRLCYGASSYYGAISQETSLAHRGGASYQPRSTEQPYQKPHVVQDKPSAQIVRSTRATITPIKYNGKVWCVEVPSGAFVARRNGKIFITGNSGFPKSHNISKAIDKAAGAERERVAVGDGHFSTSIGGSGYGKAGWAKQVDTPITEAAKEWDGYGTALKPAYEPIIVAMKPLEGTYAENALKHGVAGLWIDGGRLEGAAESFIDSRDDKVQQNAYGKYGTSDYDGSKCRWPANVILDETAAAMLPEASRFFYTAKASKAERGRQNKHPTVKPIDLMQYLCKLTRMPKKGIVLDPFCGSGTTCIAAKIVGRSYVGIELDKASVLTVKERIKRQKAWEKEWEQKPGDEKWNLQVAEFKKRANRGRK